MLTAAAALSDGPKWTDVMTAFGTVGAVIVAVGIALVTDWRSRNQIAEERRLALEREQLAQAYLVQVVLGQHIRPDPEAGDEDPSEVRRVAVMVVNHGSFTITTIEAQLCTEDSMIPYSYKERRASLAKVPELLATGYYRRMEQPLSNVLTPFDEGIRFQTDDIHTRHLINAYPVVRWTDQWGTRWEHKKGVVHRITDAAAWEP